MADQREAEVLLQVDNGKLLEIKGREKIIVAKGVEVMIVSLTPTPEEVEQARQQLNLPEGSLTTDGQKPMVFILAADYKIPVCTTVPAIQESPHEYVFAVPNLWMGITFPEDEDAEVLEAFGMLIKTYGVLRQKPASSATNRAKPAEQPQEQARSVSPTAPAAAAAVTGTGAYGASEYGATPAEGEVVHAPKAPLSTRVAHGIGFLSRVAVKGIRKGTEIATGGIKKGSEVVQEKTTPCEEPVHVPTEVKEKLGQARTVTKSAVLVSTGLATAMVGVSAALGTGAVGVVGKVLPKGGGNLLAKTNNSKFDGVKEVGGAAVGGVATVFVEATDAARTILTATCDGISGVVTHKFGGEVGQATEETLGIVQDGVAVQQNIKNIGVKAVAKRAAKHAGKEFLDQLDDAGNETNRDLEAGSAPVVEEPTTPPQATAGDQNQAYSSAYGAPSSS